MKLLICASEYYPYGSGIANVLYNVVEQFKKREIDCIVCSPTGPDIKLGSEKLIKKYGIIGLVYYWYEVSKYFKNKGNDFDFVWCNNPFFLKNPFHHCLVTMHSTYYGELFIEIFPFHIQVYKKITSFLEKSSLIHLKSDVLFTGVGHNVCTELEAIGIDKRRVRYIPNGVNVDLFKGSDQKNLLRAKFGIPEDSKVMLSLGRLLEQKDPLTLLKVFSTVSKNTKNLTLLVAGTGELFEKSKKIVKDYNLTNVLFLGYVDQIDTSDLYACSDYFIISSRYEGGEPPLTLSEAMSSGLPCIVSNIPNFKIVEKADCGIVVDFNDSGAAAKKIVDYLSKDNSQHSINSRLCATKFLDWKNIAESYLEEFKKV